MTGEQGSWQFDLEEYIRESEPDRAARADAWQTAIGLQAVDGLPTSDYLLQTAKEHIEGTISIGEAQERIQSYYQERTDRRSVEADDTQEGDVVSSRIAQILSERAFTFSPAQLNAIHRRLFKGLLPTAGEYRSYNITKKEWVLKGDTVYYASADSIEATLDYDFSQERSFSYRGLSKVESVRHLASFVSGIWQIHPFREGNTRTTAVFAIKYLSSLGFEVDNTPFKAHSWYFRNALVRANYENLEAGIHETQLYLDRFFDNLLLGKHHELQDRYLHIDWVDGDAIGESEVTDQVSDQVTDQVSDQVTDQVSDQVSDQVKQLLKAVGDSELTAVEIMALLGLSHRPTFRKNYLDPALKAGLIERTVPDKPKSRLQKYRRRRTD